MVRRVCVRTCLLPRHQHLRADTRCLGFLVGLVAIAALVAVFLGYCVTSKGLASLDDVEVGLLQVAATLHGTGFTNQLKRRAVAALRYGPWLPVFAYTVSYALLGYLRRHRAYDQQVHEVKQSSQDLTVCVPSHLVLPRACHPLTWLRFVVYCGGCIHRREDATRKLHRRRRRRAKLDRAMEATTAGTGVPRATVVVDSVCKALRGSGNAHDLRGLPRPESMRMLKSVASDAVLVATESILNIAPDIESAVAHREAACAGDSAFDAEQGASVSSLNSTSEYSPSSGSSEGDRLMGYETAGVSAVVDMQVDEDCKFDKLLSSMDSQSSDQGNLPALGLGTEQFYHPRSTASSAMTPTHRMSIAAVRAQLRACRCSRQHLTNAPPL